MILVVYVLTPVTMSSTKSLFQWLRIAQTRMMVLSIIHGLRPNPKLKAILDVQILTTCGARRLPHTISFGRNASFQTVCTFASHIS